jgi:hypothetical protein
LKGWVNARWSYKEIHEFADGPLFVERVGQMKVSLGVTSVAAAVPLLGDVSAVGGIEHDACAR